MKFKLYIIHIVARALGIHIKVGELPYGAPWRGEVECSGIEQEQ